MPKNTLYVTGFTRESKAADLAPDFEKFGELVRLDIPPPRSDDGEKYAFVEYKSTEDCEKALELDGKVLPYAMKDGLTVQLARSDPFASRRGARGGFRGRGGYRGSYPPPRGGRGGYGYPSPYPPPGRGSYGGGRGGYGYQSYGYERGGYGGGYGYPGSDRDGYGGYGGYGGYERDDYYGGYDDYRREPPRDDRGHGFDYRDRYAGDRERRRPSDRNYESRRSYNGDRDASEIRSDRGDRGDRGDTALPVEEYGRGRYSRSNSPNRAKSRSRSPSR